MRLPLSAKGHRQVAEARHGARVVVAKGVLPDLESSAVELFGLRELALFMFVSADLVRFVSFGARRKVEGVEVCQKQRRRGRGLSKGHMKKK